MHAVILLALALFAPATDKPADSRAEIIGAWRGESKCLVHPSPCNDEVAYYVVRPVEGKADRVAVDGYKVVAGKPDFMGALDCSWNPQKHTATCEMPKGAWVLVISGKEMNGSITLTDGTLYRRMHLTKEKSGS